MNVLVIAPHPDDEAIGCGGAILQHTTSAGDRVAVVFLTSGERGLKLEPEPARQTREREAEAAGEVLRVHRLSFLRLPDTLVADHQPAAVAALRSLLDVEQPQRIYVPHPADDHPDHKASLPILWEALRTRSQDSAQPPSILGYEVWTPMPSYDDGADITRVMADKLRAVRCHRSQVALLRYDRAVRGLNTYRGALAWNCRFAEVYQHLFPGQAKTAAEQPGGRP